ncbi:MAG TPA: hypothetical protein VLA19_31525 [Herpetosiphonaceae bacterium]|nr:hypothetical protein [Herpetosiphonaceae bacterium]
MGDTPGQAAANQAGLPAYTRSVRFGSSATAKRAYLQVQELLRRHEESELSVYNLLLNQVPHVVVLGDTPEAPLHEHISQALAAGEMTRLPVEVLHHLARRRAQQRQKGPWVEEHHRPGKQLPE